MSNELEAAINVLVKRVKSLSDEVVDLKKTVNSLCRASNQEPIYSDADVEPQGFSGMSSLRADHFYGKSPTVAAREYLDMRNSASRLEEILDALAVGGFDFEAQGWNETMRLKNLGISISKNTNIFHRLPNKMIGLMKWYPDVKHKKVVAKENDGNGLTESVSDVVSDNGKEIEVEAVTVDNVLDLNSNVGDGANGATTTNEETTENAV